jgi:peptidoglycan/xylan/chitin deacetylase (PgdA/CDA1 family)
MAEGFDQVTRLREWSLQAVQCPVYVVFSSACDSCFEVFRPIEPEKEAVMSGANKQILCGFGIDVDAVAGWLGSYGGQDSPFDISRGLFAGEVGTPRLLRLYDRYKIKTSWFIPGHSIETFPEQMREVAQAGHEIGAHGYSHENPVSMTPRQEEDVLARSVELVHNLAGRNPRGFVAPWWEMSSVTAELLLKYGFRYDHSQGHHDFEPYYARIGESWTKVDYSKTAAQ